MNIDDMVVYTPEDEHKIDIAVIVGGDGSILWTLKFF